MAAGVTYSGSDHNSASLPLLMEHTSSSASNQEHLVVNVSSVRPTIPIAPHGDVSRSVDAQEGISSSSREAQIDGASTSAARANFGRHGDLRHYRRRQRTSPLNSGLWISIEFTITLCQIIASVVVLAVSRHEKPQAPLFAWIIGYAAGCLATLPHLYWRYRHRYIRASEQDPSSTSLTPRSRTSSPQDPPYTAMSIPEDALEEGRGNSQVSQDNSDSVARTRRVGVLIERFKMALDCFFAVWFVVGNVWIFGSHSSAHHAPNLYRLCIVFLTFSCIGYAMPFILCGTICCCLPCIISILGLREDQSQTRGASTEVIDSMPKYKFKERKLSERVGSKGDSGTDSESSCNGGIIGSGTEKERCVSGEDAVCCICLGRYKDGEDLRELPCSHFFHVGCVDKWLKINASCPLCKHEIGETEGALESNGDSGLQRGSQT